MTTQRKPAPEVDHGGRVFYVESGKVYEGRKAMDCRGCAFGCFCDISGLHGFDRRAACADGLNGRRGHRSLRPVQAVG